MKGALLLQSNDVELVNRGYNVALKLIPNVVGQMTLTQLEYLEANPPELANAATRALQINLQPATESRNVIEQPKVIVPNLRQTGSTLADWLKGREELHKFFTGETIVLTDLFALTPEELASATLMPAFRPAGATNRQAVDWKLKIGETTPFEEVDVMKYKNSNGSKEHELYLLNRSTEPDTDTLGKNAKSPNNLILVKDKLWIGLFLWADADTLHRAITGSPLDPNTWCWFPHDRLPGGKVACGYSGGGRSQFSWYYAVSCYPNYGARSAKKVPRKS